MIDSILNIDFFQTHSGFSLSFFVGASMEEILKELEEQ